jgi:hypothetical protein
MSNINESKKHHFLYKTVNLLNGKYYVGIHSTSNLKDGYLGSGKRLRRAIRKYGKENFQIEILEFFDSREKLVAKEKELVNEALLQDPMCMNLQPGGGGGLCSEEHKENWIKAGLEKVKWLKENDVDYRSRVATIASENNKRLWKLGVFKHPPSFKGKKHLESSKRKISEARKGTGLGVNNSQYGTHWITDEKINKKIKLTDKIPPGWRAGRVLKKK